MLNASLEGKKIAGFYFGVPFTGNVFYEDIGSLFGTAFYVHLHEKITVYGTERDSLVVYKGRDNFKISD
jgi:hypothetical protein